jgi:SpoVK/Ycf46/Vps4 family AAA+-type ATPase
MTLRQLIEHLGITPDQLLDSDYGHTRREINWTAVVEHPGVTKIDLEIYKPDRVDALMQAAIEEREMTIQFSTGFPD